MGVILTPAPRLSNSAKSRRGSTLTIRAESGILYIEKIYNEKSQLNRFMSSNSVSSRHFILGLLAQQPMTGYDIKRVLKRLSWLVGSLSYGSLYPALHALKEDGLVTVDVDAQADRPSRKIYSLTQAGRRELEKWVNQPTRSNASMKAFVMRLMLADSFSPAGLITQLHQRRAQVATQRADLEQRVAALDYKVNLGRRLALDYGLALADTELDWLDGMLDRFFEEPLPMEGVHGG